MSPMFNPENPARQRGFTLIELLVGMAIGLMVVIAAMSSLVGTLATSNALGDTARLQQRADMIFRIMGFQTQHAGALQIGAAPGDPSRMVFSVQYQGLPTLAPSPLSVFGTSGDSVAPETLQVGYQVDVGSRDCLGNTAPADQFTLANTFKIDSLKKQLICKGANAEAGTQPVATGVEDLRFWYGVQAAPGAGMQYFEAKEMQPTDWAQVSAVSVCLQLLGEQGGGPRLNSAAMGCNNKSLTVDGHIRRVFRRTFTLQNAV